MTSKRLWARGALLPMSMAATAATFTMVASPAIAFQLDSSDDWSIRWDNTFKAGTMYRLKDADPKLSSAATAVNLNAGDQNFKNKGIVSERLDVLSEFDAVWKRDFGVRVSAAGWYDDKYHGTTDATDYTGQNPNDEFPSETRHLSGHKAEVLDAFGFGGVRFENGMKLTGRLGQHALLWGESLFFGDNAISRAQGPLDIDKLLSSPGAQVREVIRPVPQISGQLQLSPEVSIGAYYQLRWEEDRLPPPGSYFSSFNNLWGSNMIQNLGPGGILTHGQDDKGKDSGLFGVQLKWRLGETDLGFYAAQYNDKGGQIYANLDDGTYHWKFPNGIKTVGMSASHSIGIFNLAAELSFRDDMPLRSDQMFYGLGRAAPDFAKGRTAHFNFSGLAALGPNFIAEESTFIGEFAWNRVLSKDDPDHVLDPAVTRDASAIRLSYAPMYRQVVSGLDLSVPVGLGYNLSGFSSVTPWNARDTGDLTLGLEGTYETVWNVALKYTKYLGDTVPVFDYSTNANGTGNSFADRDFISLTVRRTF